MVRALAEGTQDARLFLHGGVIDAASGRHREAKRRLKKAERLRATLPPSETTELTHHDRERRRTEMKRLFHRTLTFAAAAGVLLLAPITLVRPVTWTRRSSRWTMPPTPPMYAFVQDENGRKSLVTALGVYPFEERHRAEQVQFRR